MSLTPVSSRKRVHSEISSHEESPPSSPASNVAQRALASGTFGTPPGQTAGINYHICPPLKKESNLGEELFPAPIPISAESELAGFEIPDALFLKARTTLTYEDNGITRNVCKQHSRNDCGSTALFMLLTDLVRESGPLPITTEFWKWYSTCDLAHATLIQEKARGTAGVELEIHRVPHADPLTYLKNLINSSKHSVISAITHPKIEGHWIVVDKITETDSFIRDPKTGKAYKVPNQTMLSYYQIDDDVTNPIDEYALSISGRIKDSKAIDELDLQSSYPLQSPHI